jgi:uncharacterized protein
MNDSFALNRRSFVYAGAASLVSCASTPSPSPLAKPSLAELGIYSAGSGSAFLPYAQALGAALNAAGLPTIALNSTGSIENLRKVNTEPGRLGTVFMGTAYEAITGTGEWTLGQKLTNVRALFPMYETSFQLAALRSTGIASLAQLSNQRVGVGPAGGPAESFFKGLLQVRNLQCTLINGSPAQLSADLLSGKIDALWQGASLPIPALKQAADAADVVVFGLSTQEQTAMLERFTFLARTTVPANSYRGQTQALLSVAGWNFVVCHAALGDADAYWITKTALERSAAAQADKLLASTRAEFAATNSVLAFHPGAVRYLRERGVALLV